MPDREKVTEGLNYCTHIDGVECTNCPYWQNDDCVEALHADAIALLKEQEDEIAFLKKMQLQTVHNMREGDIGEAVARILHLEGW